MRAVELGAKLAIRLNPASEGLFQQHAITSLDELTRMRAMVSSWSDQNGCFTDARLDQIGKRGKSFRIRTEIARHAAGGIYILIDQCNQTAGIGFSGKLIGVQSMNGAHAASSDDGDSQGLGHELNSILNRMPNKKVWL